VVGLGNPGLKYAPTRHNLGFMLADRLGDEFRKLSRFALCDAQCLHLRLAGKDAVVAKPQSYMNLSGGPVACLMEKLSQPKLLVACDDVNLPLGTVRLRARGSAGGHKGLKDIIEKLGSEEFLRVRIGCGPPTIPDLAEFVLSPFEEEEWPLVRQALELARDLVVKALAEGLESATLRVEDYQPPNHGKGG